LSVEGDVAGFGAGAVTDFDVAGGVEIVVVVGAIDVVDVEVIGTGALDEVDDGTVVDDLVVVVGLTVVPAELDDAGWVVEVDLYRVVVVVASSSGHSLNFSPGGGFWPGCSHQALAGDAVASM
jgi:hypothetical protein